MNHVSGWKAVAEYYGLHTQLIKLCEEIGELIAANEMFTAGAADHSAVITEIADVFALSEQVDYLLGDRTGELEDLIERDMPAAIPLDFAFCGACAVTSAARMANYDMERKTLLEPLSRLLASLWTYCRIEHCEQAVRNEKTRKLKRQQQRIRKEREHANQNK